MDLKCWSFYIANILKSSGFFSHFFSQTGNVSCFCLMWCIESIRSTSRAIHTHALFSRFTSFAAWNIADYDENKIQNDTRSRTRFRCYVMSVLKIKCSLKCMSVIRRRKRMYTNEWTFAFTAFHFEVQMWFTFTNHTDCIESWINGFIEDRAREGEGEEMPNKF